MAEARIPPHSIEAEKAVLGALLTENDIYDSVSNIVNRNDFYRDAHRIIYEAIENIVRRGNRRVDMVLLTEELTRMKKLDEVGGINYIAELTNDSMAAFNVEDHARIVYEKATLRRLIDTGNRIVGESYEGTKTVPDILNDAESSILNVTGAVKGEKAFVSLGDALVEKVKYIGELQKYGDSLIGISTGFKDLDEITNGLQRSDLILPLVRPWGKRLSL